jgi:hypothetical protein
VESQYLGGSASEPVKDFMGSNSHADFRAPCDGRILLVSGRVCAGLTVVYRARFLKVVATGVRIFTGVIMAPSDASCEPWIRGGTIWITGKF